MVTDRLWTFSDGSTGIPDNDACLCPPRDPICQERIDPVIETIERLFNPSREDVDYPSGVRG